jgi:MSHA biogenesis protein MshN
MVVEVGFGGAAHRPRGVSVINKMLQELDRRNATAGSEAEQPPQQVKVVASSRGGHEWFWRIVAVLMLGAVAWVAWVAFQLQPRPSIATELAFKAAEQARISPTVSGATSAPPPSAAPPAPAPTPAAPVAAAPPGEAQKAPAREPSETLKLAQAIETPISERPLQEAPKPEAAKPEAKVAAPAPQPSPPAPAPPPAVTATPEPAKPPAAEPKAVPPQAVIAAPKTETRAPPQTSKALVDKRDRARSATETSETHFRRAAVFLNQGRVSEAEDHLVGALQADPSHAAARQAYVALLLEQQRLDAAKRVLLETLTSNPAQPTFALALARIFAEQRDYFAALDAMDRAGSVARNADFQALRGTVLQRMGRHPEAVEAYEVAVQGAAQPGTTWVGMGISLEAVGRKADAAQAYRRSLGGGLNREVREYAESRVRALE